MPYPSRLVRCNINATTPGEIVTNTVWIRFDTLAQINQDQLQLVVDRVRNSWATAVSDGFGTGGGLGPIFSNAMQWRTVTGYLVDSAGRSQGQAEATFAPATKGAEAFTLPPQTALVVTLLTGAPGRSARGRIFLGGLAQGVGTTDGRVPIALRDRYARNIAGFYGAVRNNPGGGDDFRPVVVSPKLGTARKITAITVGDLYDTMRSRRNRLVEARVRFTVDE